MWRYAPLKCVSRPPVNSETNRIDDAVHGVELLQLCRAAQCRAADVFQVQKKTTRLKLEIHSISLTMCQDHFTNASGNFHFSIRATIVSIVSIATCNLFWTDGEEWFSCSPRINQVCACTDSLKIASCIFWFRSHLLPFTLWGFIF